MTVADRLYEVLYGSRLWTVEHGDCRSLLGLLPDACVDAVITDPPYELGFMGRGWDRTGIAFNVDMWREVLRVCKPGAHVLSFGGTRTYHRMACAIEDAGFLMRDQIDWLYGEGMPKGQNVSKAIDKAAGAVRKVVGQRVLTGNAAQTTQEKGGTYGSRTDSRGVAAKVIDVTEAATEEAKQWAGWGTGLKPGHEPIAMAMKPLEGTFRTNVLKYGVGPIHVDACRIGESKRVPGTFPSKGGQFESGGWSGELSEATGLDARLGRWPANLLFSHAEGCELVGTRKVKAAPAWNDNRPASLFTGDETSPVHHADGDGMETVEDWRCMDGCPVGMLDASGGERKTGRLEPRHHLRASENLCMSGRNYDRHPSATYGGETGGASRYFTQFPHEPFLYEPKADNDERERGIEWMDAVVVGDGRHTANDTPYRRGKKPRKNTHTTVKPAAVVRWLSRLVCPVGGLILDPFGGSGTGGIAALAEGMRWIGFELIDKHVAIARGRIVGDAPLFNREARR